MLELQIGALRSMLCLGAHCDDIEIGAGATVRKLIASHQSVRVHWIVFSSTELRAAEAQASAADFLGAAASVDVQIRTFTDGFFPAEGQAIKRYFEELKAEVDPDLVLTHHREDRHQDHRLISDLTWNTFRDHLVLEYRGAEYDGDLGHPNCFVPVNHDERAFKSTRFCRDLRKPSSKDWFTAETFNALMRLRGLSCRSPPRLCRSFPRAKICRRFGHRSPERLKRCFTARPDCT